MAGQQCTTGLHRLRTNEGHLCFQEIPTATRSACSVNQANGPAHVVRHFLPPHSLSRRGLANDSCRLKLTISLVSRRRERSLIDSIGRQLPLQGAASVSSWV